MWSFFSFLKYQFSFAFPVPDSYNVPYWMFNFDYRVQNFDGVIRKFKDTNTWSKLRWKRIGEVYAIDWAHEEGNIAQELGKTCTDYLAIKGCIYYYLLYFVRIHLKNWYSHIDVGIKNWVLCTYYHKVKKTTKCKVKAKLWGKTVQKIYVIHQIDASTLPCHNQIHEKTRVKHDNWNGQIWNCKLAFK